MRHASLLHLSGGLALLILMAFMIKVAFSQNVTLRTETTSVGRLNVVLMPFTAGSSADFAGELPVILHDFVKGDLAYCGYFNLIEPGDLPADTVIQVRRVNGKNDTLRTFGGMQVARVFGTINAGWDKATATIAVYQPPIVEPIHRQDFPFKADDARNAAHQIAAWITKMLTGEDGAFTSKIVFVVKTGSTKELWTMDWDGANPRTLTRDNNVNFSPTWAPDGQALYYTSFKGGNADIYKLNMANGKSAPFIASPRVDSAPACSPDGNWIAYSSSADGNSEIYLVHPDGSGKSQVTISYGIDTSPSWAPTGRELVFTSDRAGGPQIYRMDVDGASVQRLTYAGNYNETARWSPRGDLIAFASREIGFQIFTIALDNGSERRVTDPGSNLDPSWSPDGMKICYTSVQGGKSAIWACNWDGTGARQLSFGLDASQPQWGPALNFAAEN
ncbi:Tol-Pal system beta propeller repeat protein TolB [candidate division KSB1 bacterium]|nr:Tol-Pal system beta propeller repeat protein TolB [candidate division KSB1 bacterium]